MGRPRVRGGHGVDAPGVSRGDHRMHPAFSNHWAAVRGKWFCDGWPRGVAVQIKDAPHRRKRVRFVYVVTVALRS